MESKSTLDWYVLYTYPNCEKKVTQQLNLQRIETYLPLITDKRKWSDREKEIQKPLFPNYVFIRSKPADLYRSLTVRGSINYITIGKKPCKVPQHDINTIKRLLADATGINKETEYHKGDKVFILDGPLNGITGIVNIVSGVKKLFMNVEAINQILSVEISNLKTRRLSEDMPLQNEQRP